MASTANPMTADLERIVELRDTGDRTPLFCVHAVSGSAYSYTGLVQNLGADQPVYGFEAPGFDNDRTPVDSIPQLAEEYCAILREFQPSGNYQLLGWSLGGALAYEMAVRLVAGGATVARLILVDTGLPWIAELPSEKGVLARFMGDFAGVIGLDQSVVDPLFDGIGDDVTPAQLFQRVEQAEILPPEIDAELLEERYAIFRAHIGALYNHEVTTSYDGEVVHLIAADSPREGMRWDTVTTNLTELVLPGDHYTIWNGDSLTELSKLVDDHLLGG